MESLEGLEAQSRAAQIAAATQQSQITATAQAIRHECFTAVTERGIPPIPIYELVWKNRLFRSSRKEVRIPLGTGWLFALHRDYSERGEYSHSGNFMRSDGLVFSFDLRGSRSRVQQISDIQYKLTGTEPVLVDRVSELPDHAYIAVQRGMAVFLGSES